jgi:hypothetical protein
VSARRRVYRVLTTAGVLRVRTCELCAALILADAVEHHERVHAAAFAVADGEAVRADERLVEGLRRDEPATGPIATMLGAWRDEVRR